MPLFFIYRCPFVIDTPEGSRNAFLPPNYAQKIETG